MTTRSKTFLKILHYQKYLGLVLILVGIPTMILDQSAGSEIPLLVGLFILLIATEKIEDERSVHIKTTSLYLAFIISYAVKLLTTNLYSHALISVQLVEINHFIILVLALANGLFYGRLYIVKSSGNHEEHLKGRKSEARYDAGSAGRKN